jgi:hypothetical protein
MSSISDELRVYEEIKGRLLADNPDLDEQTLLDTLEGESNLQERIVGICRAAREADAQATVCGLIMDDLGARQKRHKARSERLRGLALWAMQEAGIPKIPAADMTINIAKGRSSVVITDANALPLGFIEYEPKPDKAKIKEALENGQSVPGASLSNSGPSLSIRTK